jgi:hypothetical protein
VASVVPVEGAKSRVPEAGVVRSLDRAEVLETPEPHVLRQANLTITRANGASHCWLSMPRGTQTAGSAARSQALNYPRHLPRTRQRDSEGVGLQAGGARRPAPGDLAVRRPELAVRRPELAVRRPELAVRRPELAVRRPELAVRRQGSEARLLAQVDRPRGSGDLPRESEARLLEWAVRREASVRRLVLVPVEAHRLAPREPEPSLALAR